MKKPDNAKERGLIKGAIRRVFSRSELRRAAIARNEIPHFDLARPRAKKWVFCDLCGEIFPKYLAQADHIKPVIPVDKALDSMTWDELIENQWCDIANLQTVCKSCHNDKTKLENKERRRIKNEKL